MEYIIADPHAIPLSEPLRDWYIKKCQQHATSAVPDQFFPHPSECVFVLRSDVGIIHGLDIVSGCIAAFPLVLAKRIGLDRIYAIHLAVKSEIEIKEFLIEIVNCIWR